MRPRNTPMPHRTARGFTLIELMVTLTVLVIMLLMVTPGLLSWTADARLRGTAEQLVNSLRLAQATAVSRNRIGLFALTSSTPAYNATPVDNGQLWYATLLPLAGSDETAAGLGLVTSSTSARQASVTISGPGLLCFNSQGRQTSLASTATGLSVACTAPSDDSTAPTAYVLSRSNASRQFKVLVYLGGRIRMCDAAKTLSSSNPDGCP